MSREIKFRAWSITHECMVFSMTIANGTIKRKRDNLYLEVLGDTVGVKPDTLGQYIGIKDKNGKEIYEGDILKAHGIVAWNNVESKWSAIDLNWNDKREWHDINYLTSPFEVIGNIHENPELLK